VQQAIAAFSPALPLTVAYSGGADSTALLLACARKWPDQVHAVHIHHGLQAAADDFVRHCQQMCASLQVPLTVHHVDGRPGPGQSPEDAARRARYKAFETLSHDGVGLSAAKNVALAQHADDQVETLLLALSRGAGLPGLSAMPQRWTRGGIDYHRPLLQVPGADIRSWLVLQGVACIQDPTNTDERYTRNRIRAQLLPVLGTCFPAFRDTFARSALHAAQAQRLLLDIAASDLLSTGSPPTLRALQALSQPRLANLLRHWLLTVHQATPTTAQLAQLMHQIAACQTRGHALHIKVAHGFCQRRGAYLHWYNPAVLTPTTSPSCH